MTQNLEQKNDAYFARIEKLLQALLLKQQAIIDMSAINNPDNVALIYDTGLALLQPARLQAMPFQLIQGVDRQKLTIFDNMQRFFAGLPANHALLWGARGTGKSSLVKASFQKLLTDSVAMQMPLPLMIEIYAEDVQHLPALTRALRDVKRPIMLFCDDLSFDLHDSAYKALKSLLDGGIETLEGKILFYATSNRRHLLPRDEESDYQTDAKDSRDERISLSDRFGLWIGFHPIDQQCYFAIIDGYFKHFAIKQSKKQWQSHAVEWSRTRGNLSGRTAWQFFRDYAGKANIKLDGF
ncbi:MAG: ATP-binding protein [Alphaproteobacteria bacterium]|nr:ATP-binding protein [Alphaproteobacteria bacterium]